LPPDARDDPEVASIFAEVASGGASSATVLCLGYRAAPDEAGPGKMFDFSPATIADRWETGARAMREALRVSGASNASVPAATAASLVVHEVRG
jgi:NTE family protein